MTWVDGEHALEALHRLLGGCQLRVHQAEIVQSTHVLGLKPEVVFETLCGPTHVLLLVQLEGLSEDFRALSAIRLLRAWRRWCLRLLRAAHHVNADQDGADTECAQVDGEADCGASGRLGLARLRHGGRG